MFLLGNVEVAAKIFLQKRHSHLFEYHLAALFFFSGRNLNEIEKNEKSAPSMSSSSDEFKITKTAMHDDLLDDVVVKASTPKRKIEDYFKITMPAPAKAAVKAAAAPAKQDSSEQTSAKSVAKRKKAESSEEEKNSKKRSTRSRAAKESDQSKLSGGDEEDSNEQPGSEQESKKRGRPKAAAKKGRAKGRPRQRSESPEESKAKPKAKAKGKMDSAERALLSKRENILKKMSAMLDEEQAQASTEIRRETQSESRSDWEEMKELAETERSDFARTTGLPLCLLVLDKR